MPDPVIEILDRLKASLDVHSDLALAKRLGIPQGTLAKWRARGRIPPGGVARIAVAVGRSVDWVLTGQPSPLEAATETARAIEAIGGLSEQAAALTGRMKPVVDALGDNFPWGDIKAVDLLVEVARYIKDAPRTDRETIRRLVEGLRAGADVRIHLITQLKLIERLVEAEKGAAPEEAEEGPVAKAS